ncbi:DUF1707 domain-containing protein [Haloferax sp. MBLA0076]|uniref:DUF1707 domain-containing protein n=2 Tax=Haloferacaceae TaxID=1644056 RepID=A0A6A8GEM1_9EURY|nr:SHOCT domain-containing protein [Haloferax sp. CBA1148]MRX21583.1 DUF1707 domain-containing protein [Haloferax litoreum]
MFLVGAVLGLGYSYAMDFLTGDLQWTGRNRQTEPADADPEQALHRLRERYADGEVTDAEFEMRLERLLETETVPSAREYVSQTSTEPEREQV